MTNLTRLLEEGPIRASAPCRVDAGGTWDIKALALPFEGMLPTTVNMGLTLRTSVVLTPFPGNGVKISSKGFLQSEVSSADQMPFTSPFGLFFSAIAYFGFSGLEVVIDSEAPVRSALGGSSTALVALIKALSKAGERLGGKGLSRKRILYLAYHLEDAVSGGNCGIQDQAAAVYGGVNQWIWRYGDGGLFRKVQLLDREGQEQLSKRMLVAFSGKNHTAATTNRKWVQAFLSGQTRSGWMKANELVHRFADALKERDWGGAASLLREEAALRKEITPEALTPLTDRLVMEAEKIGCGARFAGAGAGGSVWALGEIDAIETLRKNWRDALRFIKGGEILNCRIDGKGCS